MRGSVAHSFSALNEGVTAIELDAVDLQVSNARLVHGTSAIAEPGIPLRFSQADDKVRIELDAPRHPGEEVTVALDYSGSPQRGLYFIGPDEHYPDKRLEAWTQGEDEDSRHWFPCYDSPNEMATSEMHVTVREPFTVIAIGELRGVEAGPEHGTRTYHWHQAVPHATYLTSVVAGEYVEIKDEWDGIPILYYVPPGREEDGRVIFKNTPDMMKFFSERTGVRYPYAKYSQVFVQDFIFGGMENISATTLTESALYDERARIDVDADPLIAHELAHQWFGDLLTCRDWSHGWLNEGFATFMELAYCEHNKGRDEFLGVPPRRVRQLHRRVRPLQAPHRHQRLQRAHRPLRPPSLREGRHRAQHAARPSRRDAVLEGDPSLRHQPPQHERRDAGPAARHRRGDGAQPGLVLRPVGLRARSPRAQGRVLVGRRRQNREAEHQADAEAATAASPRSSACPCASTSSSKTEACRRRRSIWSSASRASSSRWRRSRSSCAVDGEILRTLDLTVPAEMLRDQLAHDDNVLGRIDAARGLAKKSDRESIAALGKAVREDAFWAVQSEAAKALGAIRLMPALDELLASTGVEQPEGTSRRHARARRVPRRARGRGPGAGD